MSSFESLVLLIMQSTKNSSAVSLLGGIIDAISVSELLCVACAGGSSPGSGPVQVKAWEQCGGSNGCSSADRPCADTAWSTVVCPKGFVCSR